MNVVFPFHFDSVASSCLQIAATVLLASALLIVVTRGIVVQMGRKQLYDWHDFNIVEAAHGESPLTEIAPLTRLDLEHVQ